MDEKGEEQFIGKHIIVGITYEDSEGNVEERIQFHGTIIQANKKGILIRKHNSDEIFTLPPDIGSIEKAEKAIYKLHSTGEEVINPDYKTTWTVTRPHKKGK